jgi:protein-tyrosine-phosphatase
MFELKDSYSILFVCLGNICRSPMAEAVFKAHWEKKMGQIPLKIDSAGTSGYHQGALPDKRTIHVCRQHEVQIDHFSRKLENQDFQNFEYIFVMDRQNREDVQKLMPADSKAKLSLFRLYDPLPGNMEVPDPYYGDTEDFEEVYKMLVRCSEGFINSLLLPDTVV